MIDFKNNIIDLDLFKRVLKEIKNGNELGPNVAADIIDSFSNNQFKSKVHLLEKIDQLDILDINSTVVIFGCWYGSIIVPALSSKVKKITGIDLDPTAIRIAKNRFFPNYKNVFFTTGDVFSKNQERHQDAKLFINTSCEHMPPMKEWPFWAKLNADAYFAFQSNNMDWIEGHINCVHSLEEFKNQLPKNSKVLIEDEIDDSRGTRYMIIGKIQNE
jgi:ribosomal protein L11 methylase PrmA